MKARDSGGIFSSENLIIGLVAPQIIFAIIRARTG
jgi:hypothetical protein